jgi:predicted secreted protein
MKTLLTSTVALASLIAMSASAATLPAPAKSQAKFAAVAQAEGYTDVTMGRIDTDACGSPGYAIEFKATKDGKPVSGWVCGARKPFVKIKS